MSKLLKFQVFAFLAVLMVVTVVDLATTLAPRSAPFQVDLVEMPAERAVCPGESLSWRVTVTVLRVPSVIQPYTSIHHADTLAPVPARVFVEPPAIVYLEPLISYQREVSATVPYLIPGKYVLRHAGVEVGDQTRKVGYEIPFEVGDTCNALTRP